MILPRARVYLQLQKRNGVTAALETATTPLVTIFEPGTTTLLAQTIYRAATGPDTWGNPFSGTDDGVVEFFLERPQRVNIQATADGLGTVVLDYESALGDPSLYTALKGPTPWADVTAYGAIGDGVSHPLSSKFGTLAAAQAVYPHAVSLTDELDWAGIQAAINAIKAQQGGTCFFPSGRYRINQTLTMDHTPNLILRGVGSGVLGIPHFDTGNHTLNASGSTLVNYTGGTMVHLNQRYNSGQPQASGIYAIDMAFEATNNATDVSFLATTLGDDGSWQGAGRLAFERCTFVRGLKAFYATNFFDIRFSYCYFNGGSAVGDYFADNGHTAIYFEGASDMLHLDQCFLTTWHYAFRANTSDVSGAHPYRLWFANTKFELSKETAVDMRNCENGYFDRCHFEASASNNPALYNDVLFGSVNGGLSNGSAFFHGCDFAAGSNANVLVASTPRFDLLHMVDCWTSTSNPTATVKIDNSGMDYPTLQSVAMFEMCRFHSGISSASFSGELLRRGCIAPAASNTIMPSDIAPRWPRIDAPASAGNVGVGYYDRIDLWSATPGTPVGVSMFSAPGGSADVLGRRLTVWFSVGGVQLGTGGAAPHGIVPYGNVAKTYAANTIATFINNGTAWVEVGRLT